MSWRPKIRAPAYCNLIAAFSKRGAVKTKLVIVAIVLVAIAGIYVNTLGISTQHTPKAVLLESAG
jgi:hypothetical protein